MPNNKSFGFGFLCADKINVLDDIEDFQKIVCHKFPFVTGEVNSGLY